MASPPGETTTVSPEKVAEESNGTGTPSPRNRLGARLRAFWAQPTTRFAMFFLLYLVLIAVGYPRLRARLLPVLQVMEQVTAEIVYAIMRPFSDQVHLTNDQWIFFGPFVVMVIEECTGLYEALLLGAALLAFPTTWTKALLGFLIGFPMIYAMNILRICLLLVAGRYMGESFDLIHVYFWQVTMIAMVASTWLFWVVWVVRRDYGPADTARGRGT